MKAAVLPLVGKDGQPELAREVYAAVRQKVQAEYDAGGAIGRALSPPGRDRHPLLPYRSTIRAFKTAP